MSAATPQQCSRCDQPAVVWLRAAHPLTDQPWTEMLCARHRKIEQDDLRKSGIPITVGGLQVTLVDSDLTCSCGNQTHTSGFYTANERGEEVEPTPLEWDGKTWFCGACLEMFEVADFDTDGPAKMLGTKVTHIIIDGTVDTL